MNGNTCNGNDTESVILNKGILNLKKGTINGGSFTNSEFSAVINNGTGSIFNMSRGYIQNTRMDDQCGYSSPVKVSSGSKFNMSVGEIRNNENLYKSSLSGGGGVLLMVCNENEPIAEIAMTGGKIDGNTAVSGGGIYVSAVPRVLHVNNAIVTQNTARALKWISGTSGM